MDKPLNENKWKVKDGTHTKIEGKKLVRFAWKLAETEYFQLKQIALNKSRRTRLWHTKNRGITTAKTGKKDNGKQVVKEDLHGFYEEWAPALKS